MWGTEKFFIFHLHILYGIENYSIANVVFFRKPFANLKFTLVELA